MRPGPRRCRRRAIDHRLTQRCRAEHLARIFGVGQRSVDGNDSVNGTASFSGALRVVANSSSNTGGSTSTPDEDEMPSWLEALLERLFGGSTPTPTPTPSNCVPTYLGNNRIAVQSWLLTNGYASGFNAVGIDSVDDFSRPCIVWGEISKSAYAQAQANCAS